MIDRPGPEPSIHKLLADSIPLGIFLCDPAGRISGWSGSARSVTGLSDAQATGRSVLSLFRPADETQKAKWAPELFGRASNYREVGFLTRPDGTEILSVFTMDRVTNDRGTVIGYACTIGAL